jgi:hypothetical protein
VRLNPPTYEVHHGGEVIGPFPFAEITRKLRRGELEATDSYRRFGKTGWKRIDQTLERNRFWEFIFFGLSAFTFILAGLWATYWGMKILSSDRESAAWPSAMGKITFSYVENKDTNDNRFNFQPKVGYEFQSGGRLRHSEYIYQECVTGRESWAQSVVERYPVGSKHLVYFESPRSRLAMLEPGLHPHSFLCIGIGWVALYTGTLMAITSLRIRCRALVHKPSRREAIMGLVAFASVFVFFAIVYWLP